MLWSKFQIMNPSSYAEMLLLFWFSNGRWLASVVLKSTEKSWSVWMNEWWSSAVLYCIHYSAVTQNQLDYLFSYFLQGRENMKLLLILWKLLVVLLDQKTVRSSEIQLCHLWQANFLLFHDFSKMDGCNIFHCFFPHCIFFLLKFMWTDTQLTKPHTKLQF